MNPTTCADCIHFRRDEINPAAGMGECMNEPSHGYWHPMAAHRCGDHSTKDGAKSVYDRRQDARANRMGGRW